MKVVSIAFILTFVISVCNGQKQNILWYKKPAAAWTEALPVGNGTLGAMVFGKVREELIQFNEATLWSGGPLHKNINPASSKFLQPLRDALFRQDYKAADSFAHKMQGLYTESYMPLADLLIRQTLPNDSIDNYYRDLNIEDGIAATSFTINDINYKREIFASAPDKIIVLRLSASKEKKLSVNIATSSQLHYKIFADKNLLILKGKAPAHADPSYYNPNKEPIIYNDTDECRGMRFELQAEAAIKDGSMQTDTSGIHISNATEIVLFITAATSFNGYDKCPDKDGKDEHALATAFMNKVISKKYVAILKTHLNDFHKFFNRVSLTLTKKEENKNTLPVDERLEMYRTGKADASLEALYFQYGRYLLLSSSRTHNAPANLQGIWNRELRAPWSSNYTTNINVQMNYWPAESANLSELHQPLFDLIKELSVTGKQTAKEFYNINNGWVVNHNSDIWATSNPVGALGKGDPKWANWAMGANWLSRHLWEHYLYTGDKKFLQQTAYPLMKGAALFTLDWLIKDSSGHWITAPSTSPENDYYDDKKKAAITISSTMDMGIIRDLFHNIIAADSILKTDKAFCDTLKTKLEKFYPFQIGSKGQLQEWYKDFADVDPHHRHVSHLYALYPAKEISPISTPLLSNAAKKTLELRGDDGTGWSLAWKVNMWARLLDGNHAYKLFRNLLRLTKENNTTYGPGGGIYPNLFDAHPPFQIDGNFAGTAGVIEMLLQSQNNEIHLLPALPDAWQDGEVKGLVARGNFIADINWSNGKLKDAVLLSRNGGDCRIRTNEPIFVKQLNLKSTSSSIGYIVSFKTKPGKTYELVSAGK